MAEDDLDDLLSDDAPAAEAAPDEDDLSAILSEDPPASTESDESATPSADDLMRVSTAESKAWTPWTSCYQVTYPYRTPLQPTLQLTTLRGCQPHRRIR